MRELLERLTEASIESRRADEPRTLAALALETGVPVERLDAILAEIRGGKRSYWPAIFVTMSIAAVALVVFTVMRNSMAASSPASPPARARAVFDDRDLVSMSQVSFGLIGSGALADAGFEPAIALPDGVAISAQVGPVVWGAGDPNGHAFPLNPTPLQVSGLKSNLRDLVEHARKHALQRGIPIEHTGGEPGLTLLDDGHVIELSIQTTAASPRVSMRLPAPNAANTEEESKVIGRAIDLLLERLRHAVQSAEAPRR